MRTRFPVLLAALLTLTSLATPTVGQGTEVARMGLTFTLDTDAGQVQVRLEVLDPGPLAELRLQMDGLKTLASGTEPTFQGAWTHENGEAIADLEADPSASATWTTQGRLRVVSSEGEGHTSYVGDDFAVLKASDLVPSVRYSFPEGRRPSFQTSFDVESPQEWGVEGPWPRQAGTFQIDGLIPRGFVAAGPSLEMGSLGTDGNTYEVVRVAGAQEEETAHDVIAASETFLAGLYGTLPINRFIVVAPDPMFRGGLASPEGIFLHDEADASVVAHELVHAYQGFQVSRESGRSLIWLVEGTAVVHGAQLEVASGLETKASVVQEMEDLAERSRRDHAVDLSTAVYGSGHERAAYNKGAVVVTALNQRIREATDQTYTLADVLREMGERFNADEPPDPYTNQDLVGLIGEVTGYDLSAFFDRYVLGEAVPELGVLFPGEAAVRLTGTDPDHPIAAEPFSVEVSLTNLDVGHVQVNKTVLVNGTPGGRLVANLSPGERATTEASITPLGRGSYTLRVDGSTLDVRVQAPPALNATIEVWPDPPLAQRSVTVGMVLTNEGEAPATGTVELVVDGRSRSQAPLSLPGGERRTVPVTLEGLDAGDHAVLVRGPQGEALASRTIEVQAPPPPQGAPGPGAMVAVTLLGLLAARAGARRYS